MDALPALITGGIATVRIAKASWKAGAKVVRKIGGRVSRSIVASAVRRNFFRAPVMKSTLVQGEPMDPVRFLKMKQAFDRSGGLIEQSEDIVRFLDYRDAEAVTWNAKEIWLRTNPTASQVFEEFIHTAQYRTGKLHMGNRLEMEIEAAQKLIRNRRAYGIPASETLETIQRLRRMLETGEL